MNYLISKTYVKYRGRTTRTHSIVPCSQKNSGEFYLNWILEEWMDVVC